MKRQARARSHGLGGQGGGPLPSRQQEAPTWFSADVPADRRSLLRGHPARLVEKRAWWTGGCRQRDQLGGRLRQRDPDADEEATRGWQMDVDDLHM